MSKLTLSINQETIDKAKVYAKQNGQSLSTIIENFLNEITEHINEPTVEQKLKILDELYGSLKGMPEYTKDEIRAIRVERHLK